MEKLLTLLHEHAHHAHWYIFGGALLAGLNLPVSIDVLMITAALLASMVIPAHTLHLFLAIFIGCALSAWLSFFLGKLFGKKLSKWPFFSKLLSEKRLVKMRQFYKKRGPLALLIGRFIPFGVRNCLYMSSGMSSMPFRKFALWEALACLIWSGLAFSTYYFLGKNFDELYGHVKMANLFIFLAFGVTVIGVIWYKKRNRNKDENV